jgi:hypothetical protein
MCSLCIMIQIPFSAGQETCFSMKMILSLRLGNYCFR